MTSARVDETLALRANENLRAFSSAWARASGGQTWSNGDVVAAFSGVDTRAYNRMFVPRLPPNLPRALREARRLVGTRGVPARLWVLESLGIDDALFEQAGFERDGGVPSMALHPIDATPTGPDVEIMPVRSHSMLAVLIGLVATTFEFPADMLARVFTSRLLDNPAWHGFVAYADGAPAASATLFVNERVAGIYYVGTLPQHRKRGLGEAVTRRCVTDGAAAGCDMASLQASPMGLPIYLRMGFRHIDYYRTYMPKEV